MMVDGLKKFSLYKNISIKRQEAATKWSFRSGEQIKNFPNNEVSTV
jgi:hypothetical protein